MSASPSCPETQRLRRILAGPASADEVERLTRHLEVCGECGQMMDQLLEEDTLVEALRQSTQVESEAERPVVQGLIARLQGLRGAAGAQSAESDLGETCGGPSTAEKPPFVAERAHVAQPQTGMPAPEDYDFLTPAQGPGEIGRLGPYRVVKVLGTGGMGVVFLAEDVQLQRYVALKAIRPALVEREQIRDRFLREARAMAAVRSDHVVTIHQVGEDRGVPFLAMELMEGETLQGRLKRERQLPLAEVLRIGRETALGLEAAHRRDLIHRDVKPSNIWLEAGSGRVKILDFGLARASDDDTQLTAIGAVLGTPSYMPPEQAQSLPVDHRSDLFSLGCVLYRACTGQLPFKGKDLLSQLSALASVSPAPPCELNAGVPAAFSELIMRLLAKDPAGRPESAGAVAEALAGMEREFGRTAFPGRPDGPEGPSYTAAGTIAPLGRGQGEGQEITLPAPRRFTPPRLLIAGGTALGLVLALWLAAQVIIRITHRDGQVIEVPVPPGAKVEIVETEKAPAGQASQPEKSGYQAGKPDLQVAALADSDKPFVLLRNGTQAGEFKGLGGALGAFQAGDEIVVHGNGPFNFPQLVLKDKGHTLRAAPGYRPRFVLAKPEGNHVAVEVRGPLLVVGCDFTPGEGVWEGGCRLFSGGGGSCEFRACRCLSSFHSFLVGWGDADLLSVRDCLIVNGTIEAYAKQVELENNIIFQGASFAKGLVCGLGQTVRLIHNTIFVGVQSGDAVVHLYGLNGSGAPVGGTPTTIEAVGNIFYPSVLLHTFIPPAKQKDALAWRGRGNLYVGPTEFLQWQNLEPPGGSECVVKDFAAWKEKWGGEEGSLYVERVAFQSSVFVHGTPEQSMGWLRERVATIRKQLGAKVKDFGPTWDLIGPGEAYVRALAAAGHAVPKDQLRPEAPEDGPFVVLRQGKVVKAYPTLQQAADGLKDGDTIEILTDGPTPGCSFGNDGPTLRAVTLRASPGYCPVITSDVHAHEGILFSFEGLAFRDAGLGANPNSQPGRGGVARLANCSFSTTLDSELRECFRVTFDSAAKGGHSEIQNCLIPQPIVVLGPTCRVAVDNSILGAVWGDPTPPVERRFEFRRCIVGTPGIVRNVRGGLAWQFLGLPTLTAHGCLLDSVNQVSTPLPLEKVQQWQGSGNVYAMSSLNWPSLERLRTEWKSPETDSVEADSAVCEPTTWRLLPSSPGYRAGPDGRDYGADVSRVASSSPAAQAGGQAFQPDVHPSQAGKPDVLAGWAPDRRAAEWVLSLGGTVTIRVAGQEKDMAAAKDLPANPWQVIKVQLGGTEVSDAGLEHLRGLANVTYLELDAPVSDAGLEHLKGMTKLANLSLGHSRVTGSGLRHLKALPNLAELNLSFSPVTDAGLEGIKDLTQLKTLSLYGTAVTDAGLVNLKGLTKLTHLWLPSQLSDAGLEHVTALPELNLLSLDNTRVTDAGLPKLLGIAKLGCLHLYNARVSAKGFADLKSVLPGVSLDWSERNRTAAEAVLAAGGKLSVRTKGQADDRPVQAVSELPAEYFQVTRVSLVDAPTIPDDLFGKLSALNEPEFDNLEAVDLSGSPIQDCRGLEGLTTLKDLSLARTKVGDAGLEPLKSLKELRRLVLDGCPISGPGLHHLKGLPNLTELRLSCPGLGDLGVMAAGQMKTLERLSLAGSSVSDEGLKQLYGLTNLQELNLGQTKVTAAGRGELKKALPKCKLL